ncbi:MAG: sigma-70 family RNA polymerase sigma factor [Rhizobiales bacterium]|nr:sigma-70 family RNA polymerase sigma factor [Hyphomicrobiales bacterium]
MQSTEEEWAKMMRAAISGDALAYKHFLEAVTPALRALAQSNLARCGAGNSEVEDVVQETLLAIHLKRHTWDPERPIRPWILAIARHKFIDMLRRKGRRAEDVIEDFDALPDTGQAPDSLDRHELNRMLRKLNERQRDIVRSLAVEGASIRETARRLDMKEATLRVSLHRALAALAALYRKDGR